MALLGEFELIARYFTQPVRRAALGVGDDCALLTVAPGMSLAVSSDMLVEGRHFVSTVAPERLGHKALAVNLSDLAACGARPLAFSLSLALPAADEAFLAPFARGLLALAERHECDLIGGDTTRGPLTIAITVFGEVASGAALLRSGARAGDDLYVSGTLGDARLALEVLRGTAAVSGDAFGRIRRAMEEPAPRVPLGRALVGLASSAIDVSDGLAGDLGHVLRRSGVGAVVEVNALPRSADLAAQSEALQRECLLAGGDDYELVFTAATERRDAVAAAARATDTAVTRIGRIEPGDRLRFVDAAGRELIGPASSFDHFLAGLAGAGPVSTEPALNPPLRGAGRKPDWRFLFAHPAHAIALGFGSGLSPVAPGTAGTLFAWLAWAVLPSATGAATIAAALTVATLLSWWAATVTARHLAQADPSAIVCDEIIAFWGVLWLVTPAGFWGQAIAFALFRFFDAAKPGPVAWADQRFKLRRGRPLGWAQGFGILFDDFVAAICTLLVIALLEVRLSTAAIATQVERLGAVLRRGGDRIATAESCTGGLIAAACTSVAGSSDWFERGFVTYSNDAKSEMLGVPAALLAAHGAVSAEVACAMAEGALTYSRAAFAVSVTGIAGPGGGSTAKPVGTVWIGVAASGEKAVATLLQASGDRAAIRQASVARALELLIERCAAG